tara:strand:+ start:356 stop:565 length:210 start_codon:yes stop_codon:yes gene_type:complete
MNTPYNYEVRKAPTSYLNLTIAVLLVIGIISLMFALVYTNSKKASVAKKETIENFIIEKINLIRSFVGL